MTEGLNLAKSKEPLPRIAILGAGPAGLGAAWRLAAERKAHVTVFEQNDVVGGNAGSFELAGLNVDYGSHRLHPACNPEILDDLRKLLGDGLLERPRHGRIRLQGRWIHFPLKPQDLILRLPVSFGSRVARDTVGKIVSRKRNKGPDTFTSVLEDGLGKTICRDFYLPYARKIWGLPPERLSAIQAQRRVSAGSLGKMVKKVFSVVPGFKQDGAGKFFYPKGGFGQISEAIAEAARSEGAAIRLGAKITKIDKGECFTVHFDSGGESATAEADMIWSTIPLTVLARITGTASPEVIEASEKIHYRAMVLIYIVLGTDQWTEFDAHYFPEEEVRLTRLSEPKNYSASREPVGRTVLCGELPCSVGDEIWTAGNDELADIMRDSLSRCGLAFNSDLIDVEARRLPFAYPIYEEGYEKYFEIQDKWATDLEGILTFGRQGLFAHDNTHHALAMSYAAVDCLSEDGHFDDDRWEEYRKEFEKHVVED